MCNIKRLHYNMYYLSINFNMRPLIQWRRRLLMILHIYYTIDESSDIQFRTVKNILTVTIYSFILLFLVKNGMESLDGFTADKILMKRIWTETVGSWPSKSSAISIGLSQFFWIKRHYHSPSVMPTQVFILTSSSALSNVLLPGRVWRKWKALMNAKK